MAEKKIKHGLFWYYAPEPTIDQSGAEAVVLVEKLAYHNDVVDIPREADVARGEKFGAFYTDAELKAQKSDGAEPEDVSEEDVELADLDEDELVDWLMGTGRFDGQPKPTVKDVVAAAGDDPDLAGRLLDAEDRASGEDPRAGVVSGLESIIEKHTA